MIQDPNEQTATDDRLERLISRQLDGELSPEEELELNKILIKDPVARALMEEYERNDHLAKMALRATLSPAEFRPLLESQRPGWGRNVWRPVLWGLGSAGAVAAAAVVLALGTSLFRPIAPEGPTHPVANAADTTNATEPPTVVAEGPVEEPAAPLGRIRPVGPRLPLQPTHVTGRRVERFLVPVITGDPAKENELPLFQFERRRERVRVTSGEL